MLQINTIAPDFELYDQNGQLHKLSDYRGHKVVIFFYPKDSTPGCTRQACAYTANIDRFKAIDVIVLGISRDTVKTHLNFATKNDLKYPILADTEIKVINNYEAWQKKTMYGKTAYGTTRTTYIIDEEGKIIYAKEKVSPDNDVLEVLEFLNG